MIRATNLRKTYGEITAVDDISFAAGKGDVLGVIGPNGAGKSTTLRILSCFIRPDCGTAIVAGFDTGSQPTEVRRRLGYLSEKCPLYGEMTVSSFLHFVCGVRNNSNGRRRYEIDRVAVTCGLDGVLHQRIETLSRGFQRRVGLAQALLGDPPLLILDEPMSGLDPNQKQEIVDLIKPMIPKKCIVISTHVMEELEALCNRVILVNRGRIVADSTPSDFKQRGQGKIDAYFRKATGRT